MTNATNNTNSSKKIKYDIHERIYKFIVNVIIFINKLQKNPSNLVIINQLLRSVTSMGANDQEADGSSTRKDFLHKFTIVRKESKETIFWLRLTSDTNISKIRKEAEPLIKEGEEIVAIVSTIINKTRQKD